MESLRTGGLIPSNSFSNALQARLSSRVINGQVGCSPLWRRRIRSRSLRLRASVSGGNYEGALNGLQHESPSPVEDKKEEKDLILGTESDGTRSVMGFQLTSQSGMFALKTLVVHIATL